MIDPEWYNDEMSAGDKVTAERRGAIRRRTKRKALVVLNSGWSTLNAEILNLSADGALLQLDGIGAFPDACQLRYDSQKDGHTDLDAGPESRCVF